MEKTMEFQELLMTIEGLAKKMHYLYLQAYHRYLNEAKGYNQT